MSNNLTGNMLKEVCDNLEILDEKSTDVVEKVVPEMDDQEKDVFRQNVKQWVMIDDTIKNIQKEVKLIQMKIKERKAQKEELNAPILGFMKKYNLTDLNTSSGRIKYSVSYQKEALNVKAIKDKLNKYYNDDTEKSDKLIKFLMDNRDKKEKVSLKRVANKKALDIS